MSDDEAPLIITLRADGDPLRVVGKDEAMNIRNSWAAGPMKPGCLLYINTSRRTFDSTGANVLAQFIRCFADRIVKVNFADIVGGLLSAEAVSVIGVLVASLEEAPINTLDLSNIALGRDELLDRIKPLLTKSTLRELILRNTGLGEDSMETLYTFLRDAPDSQLQKLCLSRNASDVGGAEYFGFILEECPTLTDIEYSENRPGTEGSLAIADALQARAIYEKRHADTAHHIRRINFEGSMFTIDGGFDILVFALRNLRKLEYVNLQDCDIHSTGREKIQRFLGRDNSGVELLLGEEEDGSGSDSEESAEEVIEDFSQMYF
jgi:Ran GTPase-activating protein (RanGAP) involved in mRNA processing and transport